MCGAVSSHLSKPLRACQGSRVQRHLPWLRRQASQFHHFCDFHAEGRVGLWGAGLGWNWWPRSEPLMALKTELPGPCE